MQTVPLQSVVQSHVPLEQLHDDGVQVFGSSLQTSSDAQSPSSSHPEGSGSVQPASAVSEPASLVSLEASVLPASRAGMQTVPPQSRVQSHPFSVHEQLDGVQVSGSSRQTSSAAQSASSSHPEGSGSEHVIASPPVSEASTASVASDVSEEAVSPASEASEVSVVSEPSDVSETSGTGGRQAVPLQSVVHDQLPEPRHSQSVGMQRSAELRQTRPFEQSSSESHPDGSGSEHSPHCVSPGSPASRGAAQTVPLQSSVQAQLPFSQLQPLGVQVSGSWRQTRPTGQSSSVLHPAGLAPGQLAAPVSTPVSSDESPSPSGGQPTSKVAVRASVTSAVQRAVKRIIPAALE